MCFQQMGFGPPKNLVDEFAVTTFSTIISKFLFFLCVTVCLPFQLIQHLIVSITLIFLLAKLQPFEFFPISLKLGVPLYQRPSRKYHFVRPIVYLFFSPIRQFIHLKNFQFQCGKVTQKKIGCSNRVPLLRLCCRKYQLVLHLNLLYKESTAASDLLVAQLQVQCQTNPSCVVCP